MGKYVEMGEEMVVENVEMYLLNLIFLKVVGFKDC